MSDSAGCAYLRNRCLPSDRDAALSPQKVLHRQSNRASNVFEHRHFVFSLISRPLELRFARKFDRQLVEDKVKLAQEMVPNGRPEQRKLQSRKTVDQAKVADVIWCIQDQKVTETPWEELNEYSPVRPSPRLSHGQTPDRHSPKSS